MIETSLESVKTAFKSTYEAVKYIKLTFSW